jgi:RNA polymerase sigma-70 factor, ECF subfamily
MFTSAIVKQSIHFPQATNGAAARKQDCDLAARIVAGDENAVRDLYELYGQRLYAYALRLSSDRTTAEDVTQETLVIAWRTASQFRGEGRLLTWLLGIVHHCTMKALRRAARPIGPLEDDVAANAPSPEEQAQALETGQRIRQGLQELSADHRTVLELVFYQGMSLNEAAEICRCSPGTVKSRLSYARKHLRGVLSRSGEAQR